MRTAAAWTAFTKKKGPEKSGPLKVICSGLLRGHMGDACGPVTQCSTRIAAPEIGRNIGAEIAGLRCVLAGKPYGVAINSSSTVVAPARTYRVDQRKIGAETIIRTHACRSDVNIARASQSVQ